MLPGIFDITRLVLISIYASLIYTNNGSATNIGACLINIRNNDNNCERDRMYNTLAVRYQKIIGRSASLFLVNSSYKHIGSTYLWLPLSIIFIFTFAGTTNSHTSIIRIFTNIFTISLSKELAYAFLFSKGNIHQHLNYFNHQQ